MKIAVPKFLIKTASKFICWFYQHFLGFQTKERSSQFFRQNYFFARKNHFWAKKYFLAEKIIFGRKNIFWPKNHFCPKNLWPKFFFAESWIDPKERLSKLRILEAKMLSQNIGSNLLFILYLNKTSPREIRFQNSFPKNLFVVLYPLT